VLPVADNMKVEALPANDVASLCTNSAQIVSFKSNAGDSSPVIVNTAGISPDNVNSAHVQISTRANDISSGLHRPNSYTNQIIDMNSPFTQLLFNTSLNPADLYHAHQLHYYTPQGVDSSAVYNPGQQFVSSTSVIAGHSSHFDTQNNPGTDLHTYHADDYLDTTTDPKPAKRTKLQPVRQSNLFQYVPN